MSRLLLATVLAASPPVESATEPTSDWRDLLVTEVALGASMGVSYVSPRDMNRSLSGARLPTLTRWNWTPLAINGELWIDRHIPGFDFLLYRNGGDAQRTDAGGTAFGLQQTQLSYGYAVLHTRRGFSLVPRVGAGMWEARVRSWTGNDGGSFGDPALADVRSLRKSGFYLDGGLSVTHLFAFGPRGRLGVASGDPDRPPDRGPAPAAQFPPRRRGVEQRGAPGGWSTGLPGRRGVRASRAVSVVPSPQPPLTESRTDGENGAAR